MIFARFQVERKGHAWMVCIAGLCSVEALVYALYLLLGIDCKAAGKEVRKGTCQRVESLNYGLHLLYGLKGLVPREIYPSRVGLRMICVLFCSVVSVRGFLVSMSGGESVSDHCVVVDGTRSFI